MEKMKQKSVISYFHIVKRYFYDSKRGSSTTTEFKKTQLEVRQRKYVEGEIYHGFLCRQTKFIPEWNACAYLFQHLKLQCEYLHIDQKASERTLAIGFRTANLHSKGCDTILRNMILSQMNPHLNILGRHSSQIEDGYTLFQCSSRNEENFRNLQEIIFKCIFNARLNYADFLLKGIRLEFSEKFDQNSPIQFNGVAYNELKKTVCNNEASMERWMKCSILPDYYSNKHFHIECPTFDEIQDVYKTYYHPSNCKFFSCGDCDVAKVLDVLNNKFLYKFNFCDIKFSALKKQRRLEKPGNIHLSCRREQFGRPLEEQNHINIAYLMTDLTDVYETFVASTLSRMLLHSRGLYFHKEMNYSNISYGGYSSSTNFRAVMRYTIFCLGLQNITSQNFPKFKEKFKYVVEKAYTEGIDAKITEKVLKDLQLEMSNFSGNILKYFRLNLFPSWNCDGDITKALDLTDLLRQLKENLKENPKYLNNKIEEYFLSNSHHVTITMSPDPNYDIKFRNTEKAILNETVLSLSPDQRNEIYDNGIYLLKLQKEKERNIPLPIPVLNTPADIKLENTRIRDVPIQIYELPDHCVTHLKCIFKLPQINPESIKLIPLLNYLLNEKYGDLNMKSDLHFVEDLNDPRKYEVGISLEAQLIEDNPQALDKILQFLSPVVFEEHDLNKFISDMWTKLTRHSGKYVIRSCSGLVTNTSKVKAELTSLESIDFMAHLRISSSIEDVQNNLVARHRALFNLNSMRCLITTSDFTSMKSELEKCLEQFPSNSILSTNCASDVPARSNHHFVVPSPLNYCAQSCSTVPYNHPHHNIVKILVNILNQEYCIPYIQELCGASMAGVELGKDGVLTFYSFDCQDPKKTFDLMENAMAWLGKQKFDTESMNIYTTSVLIDNKSDTDKIEEAFAYNSTVQELSKYKNGILNVTQNHIQEIISTYLRPEQCFSRCFMGPKDAQPKIKNEKWETFWE